METINKTSGTLISDIERHYKEICKERGIDPHAKAEPETCLLYTSLAVEADYAAREVQLQEEIDNIESSHPGYDEYRYDLGMILSIIHI